MSVSKLALPLDDTYAFALQMRKPTAVRDAKVRQ